MIKVQILLSLRKNSLIGKIIVSKTAVKGSSPFFFVNLYLLDKWLSGLKY